MKTVYEHFKAVDDIYLSLLMIDNMKPDVRNTPCYDFREALYRGFYWENTAQGVDFWVALSQNKHAERTYDNYKRYL